MAGGKEIRAGRAFVEISTKDKLADGLRAAQRRLQAFGGAVRNIGAGLLSIGTVGVAAGVALVNSFAEVGDAMKDASARTGIQVDALSELAYAAGLSGSSLGGLELAVKGMQRAIYDAEKGSSTAVDALKDIGLTVKDLQGLKPEDQFLRIADGIANIEDPTRQAAVAMKLLGKSGGELLPLIQEGLSGIEALRQEARDRGLVITPEDAAAAAAYSDAMDVLKMSIAGVTRSIATALIPILIPVVDHIRQGVKIVMDWIKANQSLVATIFKVVAVTAAIGGVLIGVGVAASALGLAFGGIATLIGLAGTALVAIKGAILAIVSPLGLAVAAVIAIGAAVAHITGFIPKALAYLSDRFGALKDFAVGAFEGIRAAMAGGDMELAARVLWLALKTAWQTGINALETAWANFKNWFLGVAIDAFYGAGIILNNAVAGLQSTWTKFSSFLASTWEDAKAGAASAWNLIVLHASKAANSIKGAFDDTFNVEGANDQALKAFADAQTAVEDKARAQQQQIDRDRAARLAQLEQDRAKTEAGLVGAAQEKDAAREASRDSALASSEAKLAAARAEYQKALDQAKQTQAPGDGAAPSFDAKSFLDSLTGGAAVAAGAGSSLGTFNASNLLSLQSSRQDDRIAEATETTARNTARIVQQQARGGRFT